MTAQELIQVFNTEFGIQAAWPETYNVDHRTYANCCHYIFSKAESAADFGRFELFYVAVGKHGGIMFKDVELILIEDK